MGMSTTGFKSASQIHSKVNTRVKTKFIKRKQHVIKVKQRSSKALYLM